ncbi:Thymidylate kinase [Mycoplasmopsis agalactiae 14628]|uniref:Thymidylate kinase n=1 Tax=Mycoplasmopsis agalactiae 14628 TaxID=1110504 RepID=I5D6D9_MYCAA|nr:dTMP kinase [Mycoplasmopsis agalactiae]EIN15248.1 Thymidylate kinase [Mycoplasmopsis agalactiae 14628]
MFITFEGLDGSGKTTIVQKLVEKLLERKPALSFIVTREPGGKNVRESEKIRELILDKESHLSPISEALLYTASRRIHIEKVILPALKKNKLVLCDRYIDSFYAYQGIVRGLGLLFAKQLTEMVIENTIPDITIFIDITAEQSEYRRNVARLISDRLDSESLEFHKKVFDAYKEVIDLDPKRFIIVNGLQSIPEILDEIVEKLFQNKKFNEWWENN